VPDIAVNDQHRIGIDLPSLAEALRSCRQHPVDSGRFVARCVVAASVAEVIAVHIGLPHPVWAPISALVVTQESVAATLSSALGRLVGTVLGVTVALIVNRLGTAAHISFVPQLALAVAICALCASGRPAIRVCMWTCPLVLVTATPGASAEVTALFRGSEVLLGASVGGLTHLFEQRALLPLVRSVLPSKAGHDTDYGGDPS
jgi:uncharacterized membrane protein YgaE (UPF0421/DUF939 family)